ncbi:MAG TPA: helix-turn-helix transcriptional regulator [Pseudobdellovibrionaceae bacterium]|nr:helix-turn-helix transcriptional regulator [Pseudobdellovibrionaceae bacterium]
MKISELKKFRLNHGWTQVELAQKCGVSVATIQNAEAGKANLELGTLKKILKVFNKKILFVNNQFDIEKQKQNWASIGVPLMYEGSTFVPTQEQLVSCLNSSFIWEKQNHLKERELFAMIGFLSALYDHYPSLFTQLNPELNDWFNQNREKYLKPNLRRISLSNLGAYL